MGVFLILVGLLVNAACGILIVVKAFKVSVGWGLAVLFLPFASLLFVINNWNDCKNPFLGGLAGLVLIVMGAIVAPDSEDTTPQVAESRPQRSRSSGTDSRPSDPPANYASAAAPAYQPPTTYTPSYNPPQPPAPVVTDTQEVEDEWARKPKFEQVLVDRKTNVFYSEKCKKKPEDAYRIPKSVALMQGMTEAKCR